VAAVFVAPVEVLSVDAVNILHESRDVFVGSLDDEVEMVTHQAIGEANAMMSFDGDCQNLQELPAIDIVNE
jgi:hypothetical protein